MGDFRSCCSRRDLAAALLRKKLLKARRDPAEFIEFAMRHEETGAVLRNAPFHREWQEQCTSSRSLVLIAPVEHGKTNQMIGRVLWEIGQNPSLRVAIISDTAGQAQKIMGAIRGHIEDNKFLHLVFPELKPSPHDRDPWNDHALTVERDVIAKDPTVQACGNYGAINGSRLDLVICDDVCDFENTRTHDQRTKLIHWLETTVLTRLTAHGRLWMIGTPWHLEDALAVFARRKNFTHRRYAAVSNPLAPREQWSPLWPEQWPLARLVDRAEGMSEHVFSRKFLTQVADDTTSRFKGPWLQRMLILGEGQRFHRELTSCAHPIYAGVDLAFGGNDLCCIFVIAVNEHGQRVVLNIESGKWTSAEVLGNIRRTYYAYSQPVIGVESNGAQRFVADMADVPVVPMVTTGKNKHDLSFGVESLAVEMRAGKWVLPCQNGQPEPEGAAWLSELRHYDPSSHTGDRVMASWIAREVSRSNASPFVHSDMVSLDR